jgi:hypothetical protein
MPVSRKNIHIREPISNGFAFQQVGHQIKRFSTSVSSSSAEVVRNWTGPNENQTINGVNFPAGNVAIRN